MTSATKAKRFLAVAVLLSTAAGPVWAQEFGDPWSGDLGAPPPQEVSASDLFQGLAGHTATAPTAEAPRPPAALPPLPATGMAAAQAPARVLTPESLPGFLTGLGFKVKSTTTPDGVPTCVVTARRDDWTLMFTASFSKNGEILWLNAPLGQPLPADAGLSAPALAGLLMMNDEIGPIHFSLNRTSRRVLLNFPVTNVGVSPESVRDRIEAFLGQIMKTRDLWVAAGTSPAGSPRPVAAR